MIIIVDCGSQLTQNIARKIREFDVLAKIVPYYTEAQTIWDQEPKGIIISGGPFSVYDDNAPLYDPEIISGRVPVLGICYGLQSICHLLGGKVEPAKHREYGGTHIRVIRENPLVLPLKGSLGEMKVWMSHGDVVTRLPEDFEVLATSHGEIAAIRKDNIYAVQYHPEVSHTETGRRLLFEFTHTVCECSGDWNHSKRFQDIVEATTGQIQGKVGIAGVSGGVDSTAMAVLISQIDNENFHPIFINNGLLREGEAEEVMGIFSQLGLKVQYVDDSHVFLEALKGVTDPDQKRIVIGKQFIDSFRNASKDIANVSYLAQGTLYPDVIESQPIFGSSAKIKRHHNVGGLPKDMKLELVEPFRDLFKDEVRDLARWRLKIPKEIFMRHPFPGPGLAVRIIGEVTQEKLSILRQADHIFLEELKSRGLYHQISQAFAVLTDTSSVGVMGDGSSYEGMIALRAVTTQDYMTADWFDFDGKDLRAISNRIINEVKGINRVVYDVSQKPPSTIEYE